MTVVLVGAQLPGRVREILRGCDVRMPEAGAWSRQEVLARVGEAHALLPLLSLRVDEPLLAAAPGLRVVANYAVGYDNVDVAACTRRGVVVSNTPDVLTTSTAELTWALILGAARRLREGLALASGGDWSGWQPTQLLGTELAGLRLGVIGLGRIGAAVARRALAFEMHVVYSSRRYAPWANDAGVRRVPLEELLATCDVVSVHCPLDASTRHLLDAARLATLKPGAILVNTARGAILDEEAVAAALDAGRLGAVGLDVFEREPAIDARLRAHPRALVLPHLGSATDKARAAMAETAAHNIADFFASRRPRNLINPEAWTPSDDDRALPGGR